MECLKVFHRDVLTVRSHQWKYYVEPYSGCAFQCAYCLYYESDDYTKCLPPPGDLISTIEQEIADLSRKQIVYIGATIDPYQELEKELRLTRRILCCLVEHEIPVVILTKSPLLLRDLDLLLELHERHLLLVQFTVLTTNGAKARVLERSAPSIGERLEAASQLASLGIPVHFHLSPLIPGLYDRDELNSTVRAIADHGGQCIYSNILGMRHRNAQRFFDSMEQLCPAAAARMRWEYSQTGDKRKNVFSPLFGLIHGEMSELGNICRQNRIDFICEFIPGLDRFEPARFEGGIFRYGLPTVYQMVQLFGPAPERKDWRTFRLEIEERFPAMDDEYLHLIKSFWEDGQLFENTAIACDFAEGERVYYRSDRLNLAQSVLSWD